MPVLPAGSLAEAIAARLGAGVQALDARRPVEGARVKRFYEQRGYAPAWFDGEGGALSPRVDVLRRVTAASEVDGLAPADYHPAAITARLAATDSAHRAELEVLLTDALIDYVGDLARGRFAPRTIASEFALVPPSFDAVGVAAAAVTASDMAVFLAAQAPARSSYKNLREALAVMRGQDKAGGWPKVPEGPKLEPGMVDATVKALRRRLAATGELDRALPITAVYDQPLKAAVIRFQERHGLPADGVIGTQSYQALNVSAAARVISIIANMERERWMPADLGRRYVLVNIPGFMLKVVEDGKAVVEMPVIVGTKVRRTPIFASEITSLIWNPTWSVPRKLAREDILPKLRENPNYLADQGIALYDGSFSGGRVSAEAIDWTTVNDMNRFRLRQMPGTHNALGRVKFNIPNDFDVYLHDTPHREKFVKSVRTFSSGCVRVGNPMALADYLLTDMPEWPLERRKQILEKKDTRVVALRSPVPVYLLYQTAWMDERGVIQFREDIYGRDIQMIKMLRRAEELVARSVGAAG